MANAQTSTNATSRLKAEWREHGDAHPRDAWTQLPRDSLAATWLAMHDSLRNGQQQAERLATHWKLKLLPLPAFREQANRLLQHHLGHLHGHHRLEDTHYFPQFRKLQPELVDAFELLANDHGALDALLREIEASLMALSSTDTDAPAAVSAAERLADLLFRVGPLLRQHLTDEEDIVIPLLAKIT